ncbi:voltage-dependent anion channel [Dipodascopsis tothii]|uniref:voltage-dependent anion channel n=1 Tax=Dipodascopsis tothii TaxID=44089 RepID=UPI0034CE468C
MQRHVLFRIKHLSPAWFAMVMGTGISGSILMNFPYPARWLHGIGVAFWGVAAFELAVLSVATVLRFILYPELWKIIIHHPLQSLFLSCIPMAYASVIMDIIALFGTRAVWAMYGLWIFNVVMSLLCAWLMVFYMYLRHQRRTVGALNAVILLPVVTLVVCSSAGATLVEHLPRGWQPHVMIGCLLLWANGELLAFVYTTLYVYRLLTGNLPPREAVLSGFLPIGPLGQGGYGFLLNATNFENYLKVSYPSLNDFPVITYAGLCVAICMIGYGFYWIVTAFMTLFAAPPKSFSIAWWGLTFPVGTLAVACRQVGMVIDSDFFRVMACIIGLFVVFTSFVLTFYTAYYGFVKNRIFVGGKLELEPMVVKAAEMATATHEKPEGLV